MGVEMGVEMDVGFGFGLLCRRRHGCRFGFLVFGFLVFCVFLFLISISKCVRGVLDHCNEYWYTRKLEMWLYDAQMR